MSDGTDAPGARLDYERWAFRTAGKIGPEGFRDQDEAASFALFCLDAGAIAAQRYFEAEGVPGFQRLADEVMEARRRVWGKRF